MRILVLAIISIAVWASLAQAADTSGADMRLKEAWKSLPAIYRFSALMDQLRWISQKKEAEVWLLRSQGLTREEALELVVNRRIKTILSRAGEQSDRHGRPEQPDPGDWPLKMVDDLGMEFIMIPAGSFVMGASAEMEDGSDEVPAHRVVISRSFYMGRYEVTQEQWAEVMGHNPSYFRGRSNPVERVSWLDVQDFVTRLNTRGTWHYRLPTEAEWEYAARAGSTGPYYFRDSSRLYEYVWFSNNAQSQDLLIKSTSPVGRKEPNSWGLYDMLGNVSEWVSDWYGDSYYAESPVVDPKGPVGGSDRINRGGCWYLSPQDIRTSVRHIDAPDYQSNALGFRLVMEPVE